MTQYFYKIGSAHYDGGSTTILMHETQYSQNDFEDLILSVVPGAFERLLDMGGVYVNTSDLMKTLIDIMIECYGFTEIKFQANGITWEWMHIHDPCDLGPSHSPDPLLGKIKQAIYDYGWTPELLKELEDRGKVEAVPSKNDTFSNFYAENEGRERGVLAWIADVRERLAHEHRPFLRETLERLADWAKE